jgi:hypothetical protein
VLTESDNVKAVSEDDDALMACSPIVRGYSLKSKAWGKHTCHGLPQFYRSLTRPTAAYFHVDSVSDIIWHERAFESLKLPGNCKELILAFVESQVASKGGQFDDVIAKKGTRVPQEGSASIEKMANFV